MGKSASAPPAPDYTGAAKQQGIDNLAAAKQQNIMSNPNMITPFGNQTVTYANPTFDQGAYQTALDKYNSSPVDRNQYMQRGDPNGDTTTGATYFDQSGYDAAVAKRGAVPTREAYMTGGGQPTVTQTLTPQAQQTLDSQMRVQTALANLGQTGISNATAALSQPFTPTTSEIQHDFGGYQGVPLADAYGLAQSKTAADTYGLAQGQIDTSNLTQMPTNAGMNAQQAILSRLDPTIQAGDTSFKQALANQGLAPGTAAYDAAFRNREMSKNDLYNQAALQGINLDMSARQQGLNEQLSKAGLYNSAVGQNFGQGITADQLANAAVGQNFGQGITSQGQQYNQALQKAQFQNTAQQQQLAQDMALRAQPINEVIGLMGGSQIQLPQFQGYSGAAVAPAPTFAGTQAQGQANTQQYGIQQAGNNATTQGVASIAAMAAMAF
tara:strand:+ start:1526 stop:2842 length:1317 start_codon:yes stop_codon:yes gene_type:complete